MEKCNIHYSEGDYICFQMSLYLCPSNSLLREDITNLEILPYLLHFSEVLKRMFIIEYCVG